MQQFVENLAKAKQILKEWEKKHKYLSHEELKEVEKRITEIYGKNDKGTFSTKEIALLRQLECKKDSLLLKEEKLSCLKSRALWLEEGDINTKYLHRFASQRKTHQHHV